MIIGTEMNESAIAIVAGIGVKDRAIGKNNELLWHVPDDLKRFASKTRGKPVILGRRTFESILRINGRPLKGRPNIVVTNNAQYAYDDVIVANSIEDALTKARVFGAEEIHLGGGTEIYAQMFPQVQRLYLTLFHDNKAADTFFPQFADKFHEVARHGLREHLGLKYEWVDYERNE